MKRVLYIESAPQAGGSTVSLFELARRVDRAAYDPLVLLCRSNPFAERFTAAAVPVLLSDYCSTRSPAYPAALAQARRSGWAAWLRRRRVTRAIWQAGGLLVRTLRETWPQARAVARILREQRIDLVHLNDAPELHKAGILACRMAGVPCICHVRSLPPLDALDRALARGVAHFVFISRAVEDDQRSKGIGQRSGSVIHNAVDLSAYGTLDRQAARRFFGVADDDLVIGMMGRIEPWKGQRDLLAALAELAPRFPALRCLIAGAPELDGQWFLDELRAIVAARRLEHVVQFVGYQSDIPRFMAALDVLAHASTQPEPFGRVLIEGMAAGLPVVATSAGGVPEIVIDGETGLLAPPGDPPALAAALARLLAAPALRTAMGQRGRARVHERFSIDSHVSAIEDVYRQVLSSQKGKP